MSLFLDTIILESFMSTLNVPKIGMSFPFLVGLQCFSYAILTTPLFFSTKKKFFISNISFLSCIISLRTFIVSTTVSTLKPSFVVSYKSFKIVQSLTSTSAFLSFASPRYLSFTKETSLKKNGISGFTMIGFLTSLSKYRCRWQFRPVIMTFLLPYTVSLPFI